MRVIIILVLCLLLLQVLGEDEAMTKAKGKAKGKGKPKPKPKGISTTTVPPTTETPPFFKYCETIFRWNFLDYEVIKAIVKAITERLDSVCNVTEMQPLVPTIVAGNLYCGTDLPTTIDLLLDYILDKVERSCQKLKGFHSLFIYTSDL
ncbi:uncharacterized protein Sfp84E [Drosophila montana]|uniref:uncharacterized protein Sfp84E n=1 Tax=Drosophila montana TaxID=40370 RepID=UPI00313C00F4